MYRNTYVEINLTNIEKNVKTLISKASDYKYYFGVVKADCYGHNSIKTVESIIKGGCNYLAVATLEEALEIRKYIKDIPILCLGIIPIDFIHECIENNITITISNVDYLKSLIQKNPRISEITDNQTSLANLKIHIKVNTGMNRLGVSNKKDFNTLYNLVKKSNLILEGIYTHIHSPSNKDVTLKQFHTFEKITSDINLTQIPIVHLCASDATSLYPKLPYANGCRLGIAMYGFVTDNYPKLLPTFSLYSEVIQINNLQAGDTVGYEGSYKISNSEKIAVIPIGYADGIIRKNTGRNVFINNMPYPIVGNICMDMLFLKVDNSIKVGDKVTIIKDISHIEEIAKHLETIPYEVICSIGKRIPRIYI